MTLTLVVVDAFFNEFHKIKSYDDVNQYKMETLETKIRDIEGLDLYDFMQAAEICVFPNIGVPKKFCIPDVIKYIRNQCFITKSNSQ